MRAIIHAAADAGVGILLISSELDELTAAADRNLMLVDGRITRELVGVREEAQLRAILQADLADYQTGAVGVTSQASTSKAASESGLAVLRRLILERPTYLIFAAVTIFFIVFAPNFATLRTAEAILRITALVTIMAVGMTFVIICAEIDLSVGSVASWSGMIVALLIEQRSAGMARAHTGPRDGCGDRRGQRSPGHETGDPVVPRDARHAERVFGSLADDHRNGACADRRRLLRQSVLERQPVRRPGAHLVDDRRRRRRLLRVCK